MPRRDYMAFTPREHFLVRKAMLLLVAIVVHLSGVPEQLESVLLPGNWSLHTAPIPWALWYLSVVMLLVWGLDSLIRLVMWFHGIRVLPSVRGAYLMDFRRSGRDPDATGSFVVRHIPTGHLVHSSWDYNDAEAAITRLRKTHDS